MPIEVTRESALSPSRMLFVALGMADEISRPELYTWLAAKGIGGLLVGLWLGWLLFGA